MLKEQQLLYGNAQGAAAAIWQRVCGGTEALSDMEKSLVIPLQTLFRGRNHRRRLYAEMHALLRTEGLEDLLLEPEPEPEPDEEIEGGSTYAAETSGGAEAYRTVDSPRSEEGEGGAAMQQQQNTSEDWAQIVLQEIGKRRLEREATPELTEADRRRFDHLSVITDVYIGTIRDSSLLNEEASPRSSLPAWGTSDMDDENDENDDGAHHYHHYHHYHHHYYRSGARVASPYNDNEHIEAESIIEHPEGGRDPPGLGDECMGTIRALSPNRPSRRLGVGSGWREALAEQRRAELAPFKLETAMLRSENLSQRLDDASGRRERAAAALEYRADARTAQQQHVLGRRRADVRDLKCQLAMLRESVTRMRVENQGAKKGVLGHSSATIKLLRKEEKHAAQLLASTARRADVAMLRSIKSSLKSGSPDHFLSNNFSDSQEEVVDDMRLGTIDLDAYNASKEELHAVAVAISQLSEASATLHGSGLRSPAMMPIPPPRSPSPGVGSPMASRYRCKTRVRMHRVSPSGVGQVDLLLTTRPLTSSKS